MQYLRIVALKDSNLKQLLDSHFMLFRLVLLVIIIMVIEFTVGQFVKEEGPIIE